MSYTIYLCVKFIKEILNLNLLPLLLHQGFFVLHYIQISFVIPNVALRLLNYGVFPPFNNMRTYLILSS